MMFKKKYITGDLFGGLTAGIVALPLALAFGVQSGMGAESGLYGAIILGFFAALLGGTNTQISGPTGPMTVVSSATIADFIAFSGSLQEALGPIIACFVLAGLFQILVGVLKIGSFIRFIPYPVVSGFMTGIGAIIILLQLFPAIGLSSPNSTINVVKTFGSALQNVNMWALFYAALTITIIYLFPKITKVIPSTLVALIAVTVLSLFIAVKVPVIGDIPRGLPSFLGGKIFPLAHTLYYEIFFAAMTLAALGCLDSLLTSVVADNLTKTRHNSNRELIGQGIGNTLSGFFGGLPGAGATMRTLVNIRSGGKTKLSGVIHSVTLAIILLGAGQYAEVIPNSVLAGILITVGIGIIDYKGFRHLTKVPKSDAAIMLIVLLATVFLDLLIAVGIGMLMAAILFMKKMSDLVEERSQMATLSSFTNEVHWIKGAIPESMVNKIFVKHIDGPLFFGFAAGFQRLSQQLPDIHYVILRMENVPFFDQTGLYAMEEAILSLEQREIEVLITGLQLQPEDMMRKIKLIPSLVSEDNIFPDFTSCIRYLQVQIEQQEKKE